LKSTTRKKEEKKRLAKLIGFKTTEGGKVQKTFVER